MLLTQQYNLTSRVTVTSQEKATLAGQDRGHPVPQTTRKKRSRGSDVIFHGFVGREGSPSFFRAKSNLMK